MSLRDERLNKACDRAWDMGYHFGLLNSFQLFENDSDCKHMIREAQEDGLYTEPFDCFKHGAQAAWRFKQEL